MPAEKPPADEPQARSVGGSVTDRQDSDAGAGRLFGKGRALRPGTKRLPEHARHNNRSLVMQTLYRGGQCSRAEMARLTGLTRVTISDLVAELIADGLLIETGPREVTRPGKPGTLVDINRSAFQVVGIDLSDAIVFRGAVIDLDGRIVAHHVIPVDGSYGEAALVKTLDLIRTVLGLTTAPVLGIGVGSPGIVDPDGIVLRTRALGWFGIELQKLVAAEFGVPTVVMNDANAAAVAEHAYGGADGDLMMIRIGSGVGAGLLLGGRLLLGSQFAAGEIGHIVVGTDGGRRCGCGKTGCLDTWLSPANLTAALKRARTATARAEVLAEAGRRLGIVLTPIVGALNLSHVVLSGPPDLFDSRITDAAQRTLLERSMADFNFDLALHMTSLGKDIVMRGAAVMILSTELGVS